jgi:hypothetical protein
MVARHGSVTSTDDGRPAEHEDNERRQRSSVGRPVVDIVRRFEAAVLDRQVVIGLALFSGGVVSYLWAFSWPAPHAIPFGLGVLLAFAGGHAMWSPSPWQKRVALVSVAASMAVVVHYSVPLRVRIAADRSALDDFAAEVMEMEGQPVADSCFVMISEAGPGSLLPGRQPFANPAIPSMVGSIRLTGTVERFSCDGRKGMWFEVDEGLVNPFRNYPRSFLVYAPSGLPLGGPGWVFGSAKSLGSGWYLWR